MKFGFVGLGHMGGPMARSLLRAGLDVVVHNRSPEKMGALMREGASVAPSPAALARIADVVFTCLAHLADVENVYFGSDGLIDGAREGQVFVDTSTVTPALSRSVFERLSSRGVSFLDAPISGGPEAAENGTLAIMVGGDRAAFELAAPGLEAMGTNLFYLGGSGSGSAMKLVNQLLVATGEVLAAEAMVFGTKAGLNARDIYNVIRASFGYSPAFERMTTEFLLKRNFEPAATVNLILKDLDCINETAADLGIRTIMASMARQAFLEAKGLGHGERDLASVVLPYEMLAGVQVGPA